MTEGDSLFRGISTVFASVAVALFMAGFVFGISILFYGPEARMSQLAADDVILRQKLYNESVSRMTKDGILLEQAAGTRVELMEETVIRQNEYEQLLADIMNETFVRMPIEEALRQAILNETATRTAVDTDHYLELANLTARVLTAEQNDIFHDQQFMEKMANITTMYNLLLSEIANRSAKRDALTQAGAASDAMIAYLIAALAAETMARSIKDGLIAQQLPFLIGAGGGVASINHVNATAGNIDIISNSTGLTIATAPGQLLFVFHAMCTLDGVSPNLATGDVNLVATSGITLDTVGMPPNTWRLFSMPPPFAGYVSSLTGTRVFLPITSNIIDPAVNDEWALSVGCNFPSFNGNTCGWTAPDAGAYVVHITLTITYTAQGAFSPSPQIAMGTLRDPLFTAEPRVYPETPTADIYPLDTVSLGETRSGFGYFADVTLSATVVIYGFGQDTSGCLAGVFNQPTCGYGLAVYHKFMLDPVFNVESGRFVASTVRYTWSRMN